MEDISLIRKPALRTITRPKYFLLFLSPILALADAIMHYRNKDSRKIAFLVLTLFGFTMVYGSKGQDASREAEAFQYWSSSGFDALWDYFNNIYKLASNVDFVQPLLMFIISRFTSNPSVYYGVIAAIFAFFYLGTINHIYDNHYSSNKNSLAYFVFFILILPIFYINGSRWGLAAWIYFYGVYHSLNHKDRKYLFIVGSSIFVHWSFLLPVLLFYGFTFLGKKNIVYYSLVIASFFISPIIGGSISGIETSTFSGVKERAMNYTNPESKAQDSQSIAKHHWYSKYQKDMMWIYLALAVLYTRFHFRKINRGKVMEILYSFCLLMFALANSFRSVTTNGGRYPTIFFLFATLYLIMIFSMARLKKFSIVTIIGLLPMLVYMAVELRIGLVITNFFLLAPLPLPFIFQFSLT